MTDNQVMSSATDEVQEAGNAVRKMHGVRHATTVKNAGLVRSISRATYTGAYALAFGIVYMVVFVTQFIPQDNPVMDGFSDGAHDAVDAVTGTRSANEPALDGP
jgi:hypothetical protein